MSIGKFFILAILLPMATIYLTLALKGKNGEIIEVNNDYELSMDPKKLSSTDDEFNMEKTEFSINDESSEVSGTSESNKSFTSIEDMIKFKKNR